VARTLAGGSTVYDVFWSYCDVDGNRKRGFKYGFASFRDAEKHRRTVTATVDARAYVPPVRMTVAEYLTEWLEGLRLKPQTLAGYRRKIRLQVLPAIGHLPLDELRAMHLNKLYRQLEQRGGARGGPLSLTTVREVHNILSSAYSDAVKSGLVADSPTCRADPPTERECKARRPEMHAWTAEQLRAFLAANAGDHYLPIWHVAAATGLRRGEVLGLRWDDVDLDTGRLSVRRSLGYADTAPGEPKRLVFGPVKNHAAYLVHLDTATVAVLRQHRLAQARDRLALGPRWVDQDLVFARGSLWLHQGTHAGGPLDPERVSVSFQAAVTRSGVQRIRLHDLRHTWATLALKAGVHPKVVQQRLNHATISITLDIYSHVVGGMDAEAAQTVADLFTVTEEADASAAAVVRPRSLRRGQRTS
jgi:integrase